MKKLELNPSYPTVPILIVVVISGLVLLFFGTDAISVVREALATGRIYSVGIIVDDTRMIYRSSSPGEYWAMVGLFITNVVVMIPVGIFMPIRVIIDYIKKLGAKREQA